MLGLGALAIAATATPSLSPARAQRRERLLVVLTSTGRIPGSDRPTGLWWSEFAEPFDIFRKAGFDVDVASTRGGAVPVDPRSGGEARARNDVEAWNVSRTTSDVGKARLDDYAGIFLPGGHGTMWDFPGNAALAALVGGAIDRGVPVGSVCHGPAGLVSARDKAGKSVVAGRRVNGFTDAEEAAAGMTSVVPFLLETRLRELGGRFEGAGVFAPFAVRDGALITGQNPASSEQTARLLLQAVTERTGAARRSG
ncbi:MAG: type 1 glutamine amidotransferase domain-containing protein [Reyranella sp.]|nr:type 1 glutamine amidotransferase domain-containing protein [Reyranella sp.]